MRKSIPRPLSAWNLWNGWKMIEHSLGQFQSSYFCYPYRREKVVLRVEVIRGMFTPALSTEGQRSPSCRLEQQGHSPKTRALNSLSSLPAHYLSAQQNEFLTMLDDVPFFKLFIYVNLYWHEDRYLEQVKMLWDILCHHRDVIKFHKMRN